MLLSSGRVDLWRTGSDTYYLRETPWTAAGKLTADKPRSFARIPSACVPKLKSLAGDLLLEEGCRNVDEDHWIKIFHADGSPVLESVLHWREFSLMAADNPGAGLFAISTAELNVDHVRNSPFHASDLARETVRIYRTLDGHETSATRLRFPLPARQPVAFSPAGDQVAVIDGDSLLLYAVGSSAQLSSR